VVEELERLDLLVLDQEFLDVLVQIQYFQQSHLMVVEVVVLDLVEQQVVLVVEILTRVLLVRLAEQVILLLLVHHKDKMVEHQPHLLELLITEVVEVELVHLLQHLELVEME